MVHDRIKHEKKLYEMVINPEVNSTKKDIKSIISLSSLSEISLS